MKKKIIFGVLAFLLVLQAQTVFAADYNEDFLKAAGKNDFKEMEKILERRANQMNLAYCTGKILENKINGFNHNNIIQVLQLLIRYGSNINGRITLSGSFHLENAVKNRQSIAVIKFLLDSGADPNLATYKTYLPIRVAYGNNDMPMVNLLLDRGANGAELLILLGINGDNETIRRLISKGVQIRSEQGAIALRFAALKGHFDTIKLLVENGVNINARENEGYQDIEKGSTAASLAYDAGEMEIYNYLKEHGAVDFEPRQAAAQSASPAQSSSTTSTYVQPSAPSQSTQAPASSAPALQSGNYAWSNSGTNMTMRFNSTTGTVSANLNNSPAWSGTYRINGNQLVISVTLASGDYAKLRGQTFSYTITSDTSFSGSGETWVRIGL